MTERTQDGTSPATTPDEPKAKRRGPDMIGDPISKLLIMLAIPAGIGFFLYDRLQPRRHHLGQPVSGTG